MQCACSRHCTPRPSYWKSGADSHAAPIVLHLKYPSLYPQLPYWKPAVDSHHPWYCARYTIPTIPIRVLINQLVRGRSVFLKYQTKTIRIIPLPRLPLRSSLSRPLLRLRHCWMTLIISRSKIRRSMRTSVVGWSSIIDRALGSFVFIYKYSVPCVCTCVGGSTDGEPHLDEVLDAFWLGFWGKLRVVVMNLIFLYIKAERHRIR